MGFPRQEYFNGLPFPPPGDLPNPGIELYSVSPLSHLGSPAKMSTYSKKYEERIDQFFLIERKFMQRANQLKKLPKLLNLVKYEDLLWKTLSSLPDIMGTGPTDTFSNCRAWELFPSVRL